MKQNRYVLFSILVIIFILLAISFYSTNLNDENQVQSYPVYPCKELSTGCKAKYLKTEIELKFPDNIIFLKRFPIEVYVADQNINKMTIDFQMVGMNMGLMCDLSSVLKRRQQ